MLSDLQVVHVTWMLAQEANPKNGSVTQVGPTSYFLPSGNEGVHPMVVPSGASAT